MLSSPFLGLIFMKICIGLKLEGLVTACRTKQENAEEKLCGACRVASRVKRFALLWENGSECSRHLIRLRLISAANERQSGLSYGFPEFDNSLGWLTFLRRCFTFCFGPHNVSALGSQQQLWVNSSSIRKFDGNFPSFLGGSESWRNSRLVHTATWGPLMVHQETADRSRVRLAVVAGLPAPWAAFGSRPEGRRFSNAPPFRPAPIGHLAAETAHFLPLPANGHPWHPPSFQIIRLGQNHFTVSPTFCFFFLCDFAFAALQVWTTKMAAISSPAAAIWLSRRKNVPLVISLSFSLNVIL